jgi:hypothetical protein
MILIVKGLMTKTPTVEQHEERTNNRSVANPRASGELAKENADLRNPASSAIAMRFPSQKRYERTWTRRAVAKYPRIAESFSKLRHSMYMIEEARLNKVATRVTGVWKVIVFRISEPTTAELEPIYEALSQIGRTKAASDAERKVIKEETDIFIYEYLRYPNPSRVVITSTNIDTGKTIEARIIG